MRVPPCLPLPIWPYPTTTFSAEDGSVSAGHVFMKSLSEDALEKDEVVDDSGFVPRVMR